MEHNKDINIYDEERSNPVIYAHKFYIKKAIQLQKDNLHKVFKFVGEEAWYPSCKKAGIDKTTGKFMVKTRKGDFVVEIGDYILKTNTGKVYSSAKELFEKYHMTTAFTEEDLKAK